MALLLLALFVLPIRFAYNVVSPRKREKVVEDYVVWAKFDEKKDLPQLKSQSQLNSNIPKQTPIMEKKIIPDDFDDTKTLEDRDLVVHPYHLPPPPPLPPPAPPSAGLTYTPSLFALGFITFLILLNSLHTSLLLIEKSKNSLLGSLTKPMARRERSIHWRDMIGDGRF